MKAVLLYFTLLLIMCAGELLAQAQSTAFTYQGRLNDNGVLGGGNYDLTFTLFDSPTGSGLVAGPLTNTGTAVSNGLFTATVDFGPGAFTGADRWLEVAVRTNGPAVFSSLSPRQKLTATPYAITSGGVANGGAGLTNLNASSLTSGTVPASRLGSGTPSSSNWLRGDQAWSGIATSDVAGLNTNTFSRTNDNRALTLSNSVSQIAVSNLWATNAIFRSPVATSGSIAFTNGALYFDWPRTTYYLWNNLIHGGGSDGSEVQWQYNLMYMGPVDGGHLQIGLGSQRRIVMYMQYAQPDFGGSTTKGQSHQFGFRYGVNHSNQTSAILQWNINATNYDDVGDHSKLIVWSPILGTTQSDIQFGTNIFAWDTHGWTEFQSIRKQQYEPTISGTNIVVSMLKDSQSFILATNANVTLTDVLLTNLSWRGDLYFYSPLGNLPVAFPSGWIWESESGLAVAPTNIAGSTIMHVTLFATGGTTTNIIASYKLASYAPPPGLADSNYTTGDATNAPVSGVDSAASEADEIASLKQRLERLERLLGEDTVGHAP